MEIIVPTSNHNARLRLAEAPPRSEGGLRQGYGVINPGIIYKNDGLILVVC
jgi:hypothetical protein